MPGVTKNTIIRGASPKELYDVVTDYEAYPRFFKDFTRCVVHEKDGDTWTVEFFVKVIKEVTYTLKIVHEPEQLKTRWSFIRGSLVSQSIGAWTFTETDGGAKIDYEAEIEVNAPIPGFIKRRIQDAILNKSIATMFDQLEKEARRRR
jgi:ribosome-associated toxin RatA of RatAB toxin-antitoxin module